MCKLSLMFNNSGAETVSQSTEDLSITIFSGKNAKCLLVQESEVGGFSALFYIIVLCLGVCWATRAILVPGK